MNAPALLKLPTLPNSSGAPEPSDMDSDLLGCLVNGQTQVLKHIAERRNLDETLEAIATVVESGLSRGPCVLVQYLAPGVAMSTARDTVRAPQHIAALFEASSTAEPAGRWIADPGTEPCAEAMAALVGARNDQGCWLQPIVDQSGGALGLIVAFLDRRDAPSAAEVRSFGMIADLALCAIEVEQREQAHAAANERISALAKTVPGVIYQRVVRPDGDIRYTYISDAARELFGVEPAEIIAEPQALFGRHGPEYSATFRDRLLKASRELTTWDVEATIITRSGEKKHTHAIARPHRAPDGSVIWNGVILDQTRIKEAELAAASAEARTREMIIDSIPQGFVLFDSDDRLVTCNAIFLDLYPFLQKHATEGTTYEAVAREEVAHRLDEPGERPDIEEQLAKRLERRASGESVFERRLPDGRWILVNERRTVDGSTVVLHTVVTELKEREAALRRSNRELEDFAFVASHDLQEPLRKIEAFGGRLRSNLSADLDEKSQLYLDRMLNAADRMRILIGDLLSYSRVTTKAKPFMQVSLDRVVSEVLNDLQLVIEESKAEIVIGALPTIDADPTQMRMLVQNLLSNALKYRRPENVPMIRIGTPDAATDDAGPADCVTIAVVDNGIGFDMKYADRIFAIFQRLHGRNEYEGTGIGLASCRKIVERHGGSIEVDSTVGRGSEFRVKLPLKQAYVETMR